MYQDESESSATFKERVHTGKPDSLTIKDDIAFVMKMLFNQTKFLSYEVRDFCIPNRYEQYQWIKTIRDEVKDGTVDRNFNFTYQTTTGTKLEVLGTFKFFQQQLKLPPYYEKNDSEDCSFQLEEAD